MGSTNGLEVPVPLLLTAVDTEADTGHRIERFQCIPGDHVIQLEGALLPVVNNLSELFSGQIPAGDTEAFSVQGCRPRDEGFQRAFRAYFMA